MSQASTVRPARPGRAVLRRRQLLAGATLMVLLAAPAAHAQQYGSVGSSVIVDYGVLDSLGGGAPNLPGMLSTGQPQAAPYVYGNANPYGGQGTLLQPPPSAPRSGLTAPGTATAGIGAPSTPGSIRLIPPSEFKKKAAATPPPKPAAAPAPEPAQQAAAEPPSPPTAVEPTPAAESPSPPASAAPATAAVPEPEPPTMAQPTPEPELFPEASQQATAAPPPPPPPAPEPEAAPAPVATEPAPAPPPPAPQTAEPESTLSAGGALVGEDGSAALQSPGDGDVEDVPPAPEGETAAEATGAGEQSATEDAQTAEGTAAEGTAEDAQTAALPSPAVAEGQVSVTFAEGASELSVEGKAALDAVAERLRSDESLRVQLLAYAQAIDDNTSRARRMSLSRALAVRSYLIERGVRSTRMDVRALGSNVEGEPADRVDIIPQAQ